MDKNSNVGEARQDHVDAKKKTKTLASLALEIQMRR